MDVGYDGSLGLLQVSVTIYGPRRPDHEGRRRYRLTRRNIPPCIRCITLLWDELISSTVSGVARFCLFFQRRHRATTLMSFGQNLEQVHCFNTPRTVKFTVLTLIGPSSSNITQSSSRCSNYQIEQPSGPSQCFPTRRIQTRSVHVNYCNPVQINIHILYNCEVQLYSNPITLYSPTRNKGIALFVQS
jgi:hypothetical protein